MARSSKPHLYWLHSHFLLSTGATNFIFEVIKKLSKKHTITVVVERSNTYWQEKYKLLNVEIKEVNYISSNTVFYWLFFPFSFFVSYILTAQRIKKNSLIVSSMFPMNVIAAALSSRTVMYCFEPFAFFYDVDLQESFPPIKRKLLQLLSFFLKPLDFWATSKQSRICAINPSVGEWINKIYGRSPDAYTYLGVDAAHFHTKVTPFFKSNKNTLNLFHSTDYSTLKGTHFLLQALPLIQEKKRYHLYISESVVNKHKKDEYRAFLDANNCTKNVTFLGHLPYKDLPKVYKSCDVYCFTGSPDSAGASAASMSVLEAQAVGLAAIRSIGNNDEVISGVTGFSVDPRNPHETAAVITKLIENKSLLKRLQKNAPEHIRANYTWQKVSDYLHSQLNEITSRDRIGI